MGKARFITPAPPMTPIKEPVTLTFPDGHTEIRERTRIFVPSKVFDNKILLQNDPNYLTRLASLPEKEKLALLDGNWDSFSGQVFTEWRNNPDSYETQQNTHVISPFEIPIGWKILRGFDWGYTRPFSVGWYACDGDGRLYRIRELYGCNGNPNDGVRWSAEKIAYEIKRIESEDKNLIGHSIRGIADPAICQKNGGESIAELMERHGVYWDKAHNSRIAGKQQVHNRLTFDSNGVPMLYVFNTCKHFIRTFPELVYDTVDVEDVNTSGEDHIYDELRYVCMELPVKIPDVYANESGWARADGSDPLNLLRN